MSRSVDLFADDPIELADDDLLGHERFVGQIVQVMNVMRSQTPSGVGVLAGPWGSGKSSVLRALVTRLEGGSEWEVVSFNPWLLSDQASLIRQFFGALASVFPSDRSWKSARRKLGSYATAVAPLAGMLRLPAIDTEKAARAMGEALMGNQSLDALRRESEGLLESYPRPVLVLLDDLDRLHPSELTMVFKLVRLIGRLPNVYYLLAFDEGTVIELLAQANIAAGSRERGYAFLEKIYQVRLELPPLHSSIRGALVDQAMQAFFASQEESFGENEQYRFSMAYHTFMADHLSTPRDIKRYVAQADAYYPLVKGEVDLVDFLLVTFLRASLPGLYAMVSASKPELTRSVESVLRRDNRALAELRNEWEESIKGLQIEGMNTASAMKFLAELFLPIKSMVDNMQYGDGYYRKLAAEKRVGSADYFDRYFYFGVQPDDVPDGVVDAALAELEDGEGPMFEGLRDAGHERGDVILEKLILRKDGLSPAQRTGVVHLLADVSSELSDDFLISSRSRAGLLGSEILPQADQELIDVDRLTKDSSRLLFTVELLSRLVKPAEGGERSGEPWILELAGGVADRAFSVLNEAADRPLENQEDWVVPLLYRLREISSPERVTEWLVGHLDKSAWRVEDFVASLVPVATAYGSGRPMKVLGHADVVEALTLFLPITWVLHRLPGLDQARDPLDRLTMTEEDLTFENRVRHVKAVIRERLEHGTLHLEDPADSEPELAEEE